MFYKNRSLKLGIVQQSTKKTKNKRNYTEGKFIQNINEVTGESANDGNTDIVSIWRDSRYTTGEISKGHLTNVNEESGHVDKEKNVPEEVVPVKTH